MKICKNNKNIQLDPFVLCEECVFWNNGCHWRRLFLSTHGLCGGIVCEDVLPNIFKL